MIENWTVKEIPDLTGRVAVVTGANSGLGYECAQSLAAKGANVVIAVRNMEKGEKAEAACQEEVPGACTELMQLDLANLRSVRDFAAAFKAKYDRLDILCNNAGVMAIPRQETVDGFEMQLGVNHLGHFALTGLLLDVITSTPQARIHNVSSTANYIGAIDFDDLMGEKHYSRWGAYGQSKLANIFFAFELHKRLQDAGYDTMANVSHPGFVAGNLQENSVRQSGTWYEGWLYRLIRPFMARDVEKGVEPMLMAMTSPEAKGGAFYGPRIVHSFGAAAEVRANKAAYDVEARRRFWELSEGLTGVRFSFTG